MVAAHAGLFLLPSRATVELGVRDSLEGHSVEHVAVESDAAAQLTRRLTEKPGTNPRLLR